ncbi:MAG TPA: hypothetical protein VLD37_04005 [Candidatus Bilamarchaeum sp.]|nr:hypothetical protein [Candidatus Bilamarchaeum sp.]
MRRAVLASVLAVSCATAQLPPVTIELPAPLLSEPRLEPVPRNWHRTESAAETRVVASGMALFAEGNMLRAVVSVSDSAVPGGPASVNSPRVDFSVFENGKWRAIAACQGVSECDISPFMAPGFRIRALFRPGTGEAGTAVSGEYSP